MIRFLIRLRKGRDFLVRSLTQTLGQDVHHSMLMSHENKFVAGMILRFTRRLIRHAFGLSAVEWSPFRPIQSRRIKLILCSLSSNVFSCKKRASSHA